jgi:predicted O-methyltransferase YrrM
MSWGVPDEMVIKDNVPFMAEKEYRYIKDLIDKNNFKTALEWGAGSSTIWFPKNTVIKSWLSIEHNDKYVNYLKDKVSSKVELRLLEDKDDYINVKGKFDFILIDGLYRDECLDKAFSLISKKGKIILHDAGRKAYKDWYSKYDYRTVFEGEGWLSDGWDHRGLAEFSL